jgi:hypothetical protein
LEGQGAGCGETCMEQRACWTIHLPHGSHFTLMQLCTSQDAEAVHSWCLTKFVFAKGIILGTFQAHGGKLRSHRCRETCCFQQQAPSKPTAFTAPHAYHVECCDRAAVHTGDPLALLTQHLPCVITWPTHIWPKLLLLLLLLHSAGCSSSSRRCRCCCWCCWCSVVLSLLLGAS